MGPNTPGCQWIDRDTLDRHFRQAVTGLQSLYSPTTKAEQYSRLNALPSIVCFLSRPWEHPVWYLEFETS